MLCNGRPIRGAGRLLGPHNLIDTRQLAIAKILVQDLVPGKVGQVHLIHAVRTLEMHELSITCDLPPVVFHY
jgi:hypothetical protein